MGVFDHTMKEIEKGEKNNLQEKMRGSNKYEFQKICSKLERDYDISSKDLLGLGTSCIVYKYGKDKVIKVCAKKIKFFHDRKNKSAHEFKKTVAPLAPFFLPVEKIIYDGDVFFAYIQAKCKPLPKKEPISEQNLWDILGIIECMLSHDLLIGQLKPKNVGYFENHLVLFDFHSLHPLYERIKDKPDWYHSLEESLLKYDTLYEKSHLLNLKQLMEQLKQAKDRNDIQTIICQLGSTRRDVEKLGKVKKYVQ
jgi:hypothetical protein